MVVTAQQLLNVILHMKENVVAPLLSSNSTEKLLINMGPAQVCSSTIFM
jgi:hypothetical protein